MFQNKNQSVILENEIFQGIDNKAPFNYDIKNFLEVKEGDIIYKNDESSDFVYLVVEGDIKLKIYTLSGVPKILKKGRNQYFGEKEILENIPRKSSSVADSDTLLYLLNKNDFAAILDSNNPLKEKLDSQRSENDSMTAKREIMFSGLNENFSELAFFKKDKINLNQNNDEEIYSKPENSEIPFSTEPSISDELNPPNFELNESIDVSESPLKESRGADSFADSNESNEEVFSFYNSHYNPETEAEPIYNQESIYNENAQEDNYTPENSSSVLNEAFYDNLLLCVKKIGASFSFEDMLNTAPSAICELISSTSGLFYIIDSEKNEFFTFQPSGEEIRMKNNEGLPGLCFINQDIINFNDDSSPESDKNLILFPVENDNKEIIAVLQLNGSSKGYFDEGDIKTVNMVLPFISNAVEKLLFYNKESKPGLLKGLSLFSKFVIDDIARPFLRIKDYSEFLNQKNVDEDTHRILRLITEQSEAALGTLQIIKDYSHNNLNIKPEESEITTIMDEYLTLLAEYTDSKKVNIFKKYETHGSVNVDTNILYFAVFQIVKNACDSMPAGGNVYFLINRNEASIEIEIKDEGIGIPQDLQARIFDPFFSNEKKNGAGLGLTFADLIIKKHNGSLKVISDPDMGSTFIISLPAMD